jgi:hypothetical protein
MKIDTLSAENISDLQEQLIQLKKPIMQMSDLVKCNNIKMLMFELTLTPAYKLSVLSN